ncbi:ferredoxin [Paenibacillus sp. KS1]|nr:ferredoxin [Paenibacillus sp. KS1]
MSDIVSDWFWDIIMNADQNTDKLREILREMDQENIVKFQEQFLDAASVLQEEPFLDYMEESEDGIEDVSYLVVGRGKKYYTEILNNPEKIPSAAEDCVILFGIADEVCIEKFGESTGVY